MKKLPWAFAIGAILLMSFTKDQNNIKSPSMEGFSYGSPEIGSITELSFGPEGILFMGDTKGAAIHALDTGDNTAADTRDYNLNAFDQTVAAALGTTPDKIKIHDMAVNPVSKKIYFSVSTIDGTSVLLRLEGENLELVPLKDVYYSSVDLKDPVAADAEDQRGRSLRVWSISDLRYHDGHVLVSGLSNKEFSSTFRSIPFPFKDDQQYASLEIFHAAHGQYETKAPIKTFDVISLNNKEYLMASYTCTPLVLFPMDELKDGKHVKGRTVAELGWGNSPLDMITYEKNGKRFFAMSNSNRPLMRIAYDDLAATTESLTTPLPESEVTAGMPYDSLPMVYILQLDKLDETHILTLRRTADGDLELRSGTTEWM